MLAFRVRGAALDGRLDPGHFRPEFQVVVDRVNSVPGTKAETIEAFVRWIGQPSDLREYCDDGVPIINAGDVRPLWIDTSNLKRVDRELARTKARQRLNGDEALVVRTGANCGDCAPSGSTARGLLVNSHIIPIRPDPDSVNPDYLAVFLATPQGQLLLDREMTGTAQRQISVQSLLDTLVLVPHSAAQQYVGSKVRHAETLREWARWLHASAERFVEANFVAPSIPSLRERPRRMPVSVLVADSLDPNFAVAEQGHRLMSSSVSVDDMKDTCRSGDPIRADERRAGPYPYHGASGPIDMHDDWNIDGDYVLVAQDGSIGCACVVRGRAWANNHVWILTLRPGFDLDAVAYFLNDWYPYWDGLTTGSVVPKVLADNLARVRVPEVVARATREVGDPLRRAKGAARSAGSLVTAARLLVEALIERKVTEAELIAASKDTDADRALLSRLHDDGLDGAGELLLPDLGALAELLAEASMAR